VAPDAHDVLTNRGQPAGTGARRQLHPRTRWRNVKHAGLRWPRDEKLVPLLSSTLHPGFCMVAVALTAARWSQAQEAASDGPERQTASEPSAAPTVDDGSEGQSPTSNKQQCIEAHKQTQALQSSGRLVEAREQASDCTNPGCPGLLVADCARWLSDLDQRIPSVAFEVRADGHSNVSARVFVDGKPLDDWTRGQALRLNPGQHTFRFELPPHPTVTETLVLAEGMRFRIVSAEFMAPSERTPATPMSQAEGRGAIRERPVPPVVYPLLGVGALGLAGFAGFALSGKSEQSKLERTCSPRCTDSDLSAVRARFLVGDISLGLGLAALVGAGVVYLARPEQPARSSVGFAPLAGGGIATFTVPRF
jgi:hypothetical protein